MEKFVPSESLRLAVNNKDLFKVRGVLVGILQTDNFLDTHDLENAVHYVEENGISLFEEHDPAFRLTENKKEWDKAYYAYALTYLHENFSKKRFDHAKSVGRYISNHCDERDMETENKAADHSIDTTIEEKGYKDSNSGSQGIGRVFLLLGGVGIVALLIYIFSR